MNALKGAALAAIIGFATAIQAANWPQWRGPNLNGSSPESNLPVNWSTTEGVLWKAPLPGPSGATPVVWENHVFVSSPDEQKNLKLLCFDRTNGKLRWEREVGFGDKSVGRNNMASPSPVTDGKAVYALFGTSDLAAYDMEGKELWKRNLGKDFGKFSVMWIYGSSPLLYKDRLYVQVLQRTPVPDDYTHAKDDKAERDSYLLCIDPKTGKDIWRNVRPTDAIKESQESYSTPMPYESPNGTQIVVLGGDYTTGHDAATGKEIWRVGALNPKKDPWWRIVPSPVIGKNLIYSSAPKRDPVFALKTGGKGDVTSTHIAWTFKEFPTDWSTPLLYQDKLFILDGDKKMLTALQPDSGEKLWQGNLGIRDVIWSSPTGADGKIYALSEAGNVVVASAGPEFKVLSTIAMGEGPCRSSIAVAHGHLFIRTAQNLYCIGNRQTASK